MHSGDLDDVGEHILGKCNRCGWDSTIAHPGVRCRYCGRSDWKTPAHDQQPGEVTLRPLSTFVLA